MNGGAHALGGLVVGAGVYYLAAKALGAEPTWGGAIASAALSAAVASLPDILEPAIHPRHRGFFHSVACTGAIGYGVWQLWQAPTISPTTKVLVATLAGAYLSHPIADSATPLGIPVI